MLQNCLANTHTGRKKARGEGSELGWKGNTTKLDKAVGKVTCRERLKGTYTQVKVREGKEVGQGTDTALATYKGVEEA